MADASMYSKSTHDDGCTLFAFCLEERQNEWEIGSRRYTLEGTLLLF